MYGLWKKTWRSPQTDLLNAEGLNIKDLGLDDLGRPHKSPKRKFGDAEGPSDAFENLNLGERPSQRAKIAAEGEILRNGSSPSDMVSEDGNSSRKLLLQSFVGGAPEVYQRNVITQALRENTIAIVQDESNKPMFALPLLQEFKALESQRGSEESPRRVSVYLVSSDSTSRQRAGVLSYPGKTRRGARLKVTSCGDAVPAKKTIADWWQDLRRQDVVVMTLQRFTEFLEDGEAKLVDVNLIIFDGVQEVNGEHQFARLLQNNYLPLPDDQRPRLFSFLKPAALPEVYDQSLHSIEELTHSRIFGISPMIREEYIRNVAGPEDIHVWFEKEPPKRLPELYHLMQKCQQSEPSTTQAFWASKHILQDLGKWASDSTWQRYVKPKDANAMIMDKDEAGGSSQTTGRDAPDNVDTRGQLWDLPDSYKEVVTNFKPSPPDFDRNSRKGNVSRKFFKLLNILKCYAPEEATFKGLIIVKRKFTAYAMLDLLSSPLPEDLNFLKPQVLFGPGPDDDWQTSGKISADAINTLKDFRTGKANLLIASTFAEDGLDLPLCSVIIRWDPVEDYISYAHSKAHMRPSHSHFIMMLQANDDDTSSRHRRLAQSLHGLQSAWANWMKTIPSDRRTIPPLPLLSNDLAITPELTNDREESEGVCILEPATGARIYSQDAIVAIYRYCASIVHHSSSSPSTQPPLFAYFRKGSDPPEFTCTIIFPKPSPLSEFVGPAASSKADARRLACFNACQQLFRLRLLDPVHFPVPRSRLRLMRESPGMTRKSPAMGDDGESSGPNDGKGLNSDRTNGTRKYEKKRAAFWRDTLSAPPGRLYPTVISINSPDSNEDLSHLPPFRPICILARLPLPSIPSFNVFLSGKSYVVQLRRCAELSISQDQMQAIFQYTMRLCRTVASRPFECELEKAGCLLAPLSPAWRTGRSDYDRPWQLPSVERFIHWGEIERAGHQNLGLIPIARDATEEYSGDLLDAVIQEKWTEFAPRYEVRRVRRDLRPMDKLDDCARAAQHDSLLDYYYTENASFEGVQDLHQPLVEVARVPALANALSPVSKPGATSPDNPSIYLIPELCKKHVIPASVMRTALFLPSIHRRIDDFLITKELNAVLLDHLVDENLLIAAITTPSAAMECDYERMELLGDTFLKFISSVFLFTVYPEKPVGALHHLRQRVVSNKPLMDVALKAGIPHYVHARPLAVKKWAPPGFRIHPYQHRESGRKDNSLSTGTKPEPKNQTKNKDENARASDMDLATSAHDDSSSEETVEREITVKPAPGFSSSQSSVPQNSQPKVKPPLKTTSRRLTKDREWNHWQPLGDKCLADLSESIIAAALLTEGKAPFGQHTRGRDNALRVCKLLRVAIHGVDQWSDFSKLFHTTPATEVNITYPDSVRDVEKVIGCTFARPQFLEQALAHTSSVKDPSMTYERLEYLGDAVLDFLVVQDLFRTHPTLRQGDLTFLKGSMVSNSCLAALCVSSGLSKYLRYESAPLDIRIKDYKTKLENAEERARSSKQPSGQYWIGVEAPKELSDVVESILAALFVSDNFEFEGIEKMYKHLIKPFLDKHIDHRSIDHHPSKILVEFFQSHGCSQFQIINKPGGDRAQAEVVCHDVVVAGASDSTLAQASRLASAMALKGLEGDPDFMQRVCKCRAINESKRAAKQERRRSSGVQPSSRQLGPHSSTRMDDVAVSSSDESDA